jgi:hypothetical protein
LTIRGYSEAISPLRGIYLTTFANCQTMAITLNQNTDCCETTCSTSSTNVAGATGAAGAAGSNGTNGSNAYATTTASFTMPAVSSTVVVAVSDSGWMSVGQALYVSGGGYFEVTVITSAISITVRNLYAVPTNAAVGATVATAKTVSAAGVKGDTGAAGSAGSGLQTLAKGGLSTYSTQNIALAVGANNKFLGADSSATAGIAWDTVQYSDLGGTLALNTVTTSGQLPLAGIANAGGAAGDIAYWNGTVWVKLPKGSAGHLLEQGTSAPQWAAPTSTGAKVEAMGRVKYTDTSTNTVAFVGTAINCDAPTLPNAALFNVKIDFTTNISTANPIVILTPLNAAAAGDAGNETLHVTSVTASTLYVELPANTATDKEFSFVVFA